MSTRYEPNIDEWIYLVKGKELLILLQDGILRLLQNLDVHILV